MIQSLCRKRTILPLLLLIATNVVACLSPDASHSPSPSQSRSSELSTRSLDPTTCVTEEHRRWILPEPLSRLGPSYPSIPRIQISSPILHLQQGTDLSLHPRQALPATTVTLLPGAFSHSAAASACAAPLQLANVNIFNWASATAAGESVSAHSKRKDGGR